MGFAADLNRLCQEAGDRAEQVVRKSMLDLQTSMILKSPVDTGRFRSNWQAGVGSLNAETTDSTANDAIGRTKAVLDGWKPGQTIWLTNSLPYANPLEYGHSKKAPGGMVRLSVQRYGEFLARQVKRLD